MTIKTQKLPTTPDEREAEKRRQVTKLLVAPQNRSRFHQWSDSILQRRDLDVTPKQDAFCLAYMETGNASEAYRRSYSCENMKQDTVRRKANELLENGKITARLDELRAPAIEAAQMTLEGHLRDLKRLRDLAEGEGKYSAAVAAEIARGKASGFYVERHDIHHSFAQLSDAELDARIAELEEQLGRLSQRAG